MTASRAIPILPVDLSRQGRPASCKYRDFPWKRVRGVNRHTTATSAPTGGWPKWQVPVRPAFPRAAVSGAQSLHRAILRPDRGPDQHADEHQDRRLSGGLRATARRASHYDTGVDGGAPGTPRCGRDRRAAAKASGRHPVLHGRGVSQSEARHLEHITEMIAPSAHSAWKPAPRSACSTPDQADSCARCGTRLLQPQPGHVRVLLPEDHLHPHLRGSPRHLEDGPRRRAECLLRRHPWLGEVAGGLDRDAAHPGHAPGTSRAASRSTSWFGSREPRSPDKRPWIR